MRMLALLALVSPLTVNAGDTRLDAIRSVLLPMRTGQPGGLKARGATPVFTTVKNQLREWIESRIAVFKFDGTRWTMDPVTLQDQLNEELSREGLTCGPSTQIPCPEGGWLGFLGPVALEMKRGSILVARTAVGVQICGDDESAYAYELSDGQWRKFWQSEQNDYEEGKYFPQRFREVQISLASFLPGADRTAHLILTLGVEPWCTSNWHEVYYRVWQTKRAYREPRLLLDGKEWAFVPGSIHGSVTNTGVLMEYKVSGVEGGFTRPELRSYMLKQGALERVDPVATGPRDFVSFWLRHPWPEISRWTAEASRTKLREWHRRHNGPFAEFGFPTRHCGRQPDLWQVATNSGEHGEEQVYFLVRWRPPYRFTMVSVSDHPQPGCTEQDPEADEPRSPFPED